MHPVSYLLVVGFSISLLGSALSSAQADTATIPPATPPTTTPTTPPVTPPVVPDTDKPTETEEKKPEKVINILGWKEWVWAIEPELVMRAKLDTGAHTSSIHATNIEQIELDGNKWVKFTVSNPNDEKSIRLRHKAPLVRVSKVKNDHGGIDQRYVVPLVFQIGNKKIEGEFNLNDREGMTCSMLIGRNILKQLGMIDAGRTDLLPKPKNLKTKPTKPDTEKPVTPLDQK